MLSGGYDYNRIKRLASELDLEAGEMEASKAGRLPTLQTRPHLCDMPMWWLLTLIIVVMPALGRRLFLEIESRNLLCGIGFGACIAILALAALLLANIVIRSELPAKLETLLPTPVP
jgi:hypothetical protein